MSNPFKFGSVVENDFFTDRLGETGEISEVLRSQNHLVLISPRRFGKTSLVNKAVKLSGRPVIFLDLQLVVDVFDFATQLLKKTLQINKWEKIKHFLASFRIVPTIELNPQTNAMEVSFLPSVKNSFTALEDVLNLIEKIGAKGKKPIVVLDEFQEITNLSKNLSKQMRSVIQYHKNVNYVFLGSMESMMRTIFETKKSPFYHFGYLMYLKEIPYPDFFHYLKTRFDKITDKSREITMDILSFTKQHPYYTQQLAFYCYSYLECHRYKKSMLQLVIENITIFHSNDFERLWNTISQTDKKILITLAMQDSISTIYQPTSTIYSGIQRLLVKGYVIKDEPSDTPDGGKKSGYRLDDPFFRNWIIEKRNGLC